MSSTTTWERRNGNAGRNNDDMRGHSLAHYIRSFRCSAPPTVRMATIDKENLQGDTPNTVDQPEISEKEASQTTETAKELAEETDATAATAAAAVAATVDSTVTAPEPEKIQEADGASEDSKRKTVDPPTTASAAQRPVKRARTAYFIFADDRRAAIQAKVRLPPSLSVWFSRVHPSSRP